MREAVDEADARMMALGYARRRRTGAASSDRAQAALTQCDACGHLGHELLAYGRGRRYRAMLVCQGCRRVSEF